MKLKTLLLTTAIALPLALPVAAHPSGEKRIDRVIESLELDDARAEQVREIMKSHHEERTALHKEMRERMKVMHQEHRQGLEQVLTQEEMDKLTAMKKERFKKHRKYFGERRGFKDDDNSAYESH